MKINRKNYETYFLDYIENRLDKQSITELKTFLSLHPQLSKELEEYGEQLKITAESLVCPDKESLKKLQFATIQINEKNFDIKLYKNKVGDKE